MKCYATACDRNAIALGLCMMHYGRQRKRGDPNFQYEPTRRPLMERFKEKVAISSLFDCWIWTGAADEKGYGRFYVGGSPRTALAHRVSWVLHCGPIPEDLAVLHRCDHPPCVNPAHLFLGTLADNNADMDRKGRRVSKVTYGPRPAHWNLARGERHPMAKLSESDVRDIRQRLMEGQRGIDIAAHFNISPNAISRIKNGHLWRAV